MCLSPNAALCSGCQSCAYCSQACKDQDAGSHNFLCATFKDFSDTTRPSPNHVRGIFFGERANSPTIVWVRIFEDGLLANTPDVKAHLFGNITAAQDRSRETNIDRICTQHKNPRTRADNPDRFVTCWYRENFLMDGSHPNMAKFAATQPELARIGKTESITWCGNVLAVAHKQIEMDEYGFEDKIVDITMEYYRDIIDFLTHRPEPRAPLPNEFQYAMGAAGVPAALLQTFFSRRG